MKTFETTDGWQSDRPFEEPEVPPRDLTGMTLGDDFLIQRLLGRGGMGEVYLARQQSLDRPVALKVLKPELIANPTYLSRFEVEATVVARLNHPNIVQVFTMGRHHDLRYLAMEYVHGVNLRDLLVRKGPLGLIQALSVMRQTCRAMEAAAELGLIHRDIKPENLLMTTKGVVKVADFGLCREQGAKAMHLTQEGVTLGTPMYMSPEQVRGHDLDHRSDLYSMGVTFYHLLSGMAPFRAENPGGPGAEAPPGKPDRPGRAPRGPAQEPGRPGHEAHGQAPRGPLRDGPRGRSGTATDSIGPGRRRRPRGIIVDALGGRRR